MKNFVLLLSVVVGLSGCAYSLNGGRSDELMEESADEVYAVAESSEAELNLPADSVCREYRGVVCIEPVEQIGTAPVSSEKTSE